MASRHQLSLTKLYKLNKIMNATNELTTINSVIMVRLVTGKPALSAKLEKTHQQIAYAKGADEKAIRAPSAKLFQTRGNAIGEINNIINGMAVYLKKKGMSVPDFDGTTYQQANDADEIQSEFDKRRDQLDALLNEVHTNYQSYVNEGLKHIAAFNDEVEWPTADEFIGGYRLELKWLGQPQSIANSVLSSVSTETAARVRASSEQSVSRMLLEAHGQTISETIEEMGRTIEALTKGQRLKQARFNAMQDRIGDLKNKNWLNLPQLDAIIDMLKPCVDAQVSDFPESHQRRAHAKSIAIAKAEAEKVLTELGL